MILQAFRYNQGYIFVDNNSEIKVGEWLASVFEKKFQYIDKCTEVDHYNEKITNYNGDLIKWTSGKQGTHG